MVELDKRVPALMQVYGSWLVENESSRKLPSLSWLRSALCNGWYVSPAK